MSSHQNGQTDPSNCYAYIFLLLLLFFIYLFIYLFIYFYFIFFFFFGNDMPRMYVCMRVGTFLISNF